MRQKPDAKTWHSLPEEVVLEGLECNDAGLSSAEAEKRLEKFGRNELPEGKKKTVLQIFLHQLLNPLIFILIAAAIASVAVGEGEDAIFILLVIIINSFLGTYQEYNAEKSASGLRKMMRIRARVVRDGELSDIESELVVPGDMVILESGVKVPADMRLTETNGLEIDESMLTGESVATRKRTGVVRSDAPVGDRYNMAFKGTTVISGRGKGIVAATGSSTEVGEIAHSVTEGRSAKPPLIVRMERFIKQISIFIIALSVVIGVVLRFTGMDMASIFFFVVALAVSAIPEGLPVALTVALSIATRRMARRNVIVRRLTSVESLGSCTIIASDKTGTLTVNQQTARRIILPDKKDLHISGEGYNGEGNIFEVGPETSVTAGDHDELRNLITIAVVANEGSLSQKEGVWSNHGDAMDVALLGVAYKSQLAPAEIRKMNPVAGQIPYESEKKYSAAFYTSNNVTLAAAKGAVETILDFCAGLPDNEKQEIVKAAGDMAAQGYRVLAFAGGSCENFSTKESYSDSDIPPLNFAGLVCFIDPLRSEAKESIANCRRAGIKVIMITGDHPETAGNIARELGIKQLGDRVVSGKMLIDAGKPTDQAYIDLVLSAAVFARVSPVQKLEIVEVLIAKGEFVAVTGDGVNDAPALRRANLGVAMGSGTDVAKEVGDMIVTDDNFSSIVAGVEEGRFAYDNVRKVIYLLISTGAAEVMLFIFSILAGLPLPLLAVQLLWLNLVTNGIQDVALAFEAGEPGAMKKQPRRPKESVFDGLMVQQTIVSGMVIGGIVFAFWWWLHRYTQLSEYHARDLVLLLMVFMQNFHVFNCRSETVSAFKVPLRRNLFLVFGVLAAQLIHIAAMHIPFMQQVLRIEPIIFGEWIQVLLLAIPIVLAMELFKFFWRKRASGKVTVSDAT